MFTMQPTPLKFKRSLRGEGPTPLCPWAAVQEIMARLDCTLAWWGHRKPKKSLPSSREKVYPRQRERNSRQLQLYMYNYVCTHTPSHIGPTWCVGGKGSNTCTQEQEHSLRIQNITKSCTCRSKAVYCKFIAAHTNKPNLL